MHHNAGSSRYVSLFPLFLLPWSGLVLFKIQLRIQPDHLPARLPRGPRFPDGVIITAGRHHCVVRELLASRVVLEDLRGC